MPVGRATYCDPEHAISTGAHFTCGLGYGPDIKCWGAGHKGQTTIPAHLASRAPKWLMSGGQHSCALVQDDSAICWGDSEYGALDVPAGRKWDYISPGMKFTCGIEKGTRHAYCWGKNDYGQATVPAGYKWSQIYSSFEHACGVTQEGVRDAPPPCAPHPVTLTSHRPNAKDTGGAGVSTSHCGHYQGLARL